MVVTNHNGCDESLLEMNYSGRETLTSRPVEPKRSTGLSAMLLKMFVVATMNFCGYDHTER